MTTGFLILDTYFDVFVFLIFIGLSTFTHSLILNFDI